MKNNSVILLFLLLFPLCINSCSTQPKETSYRCGWYCYEYPYDNAENNYIFLEIENDSLKGYYYGTTDEFDEVREGYPCGFFVLPMDSLQIKNDSISFVLQPTNNDFLVQPIARSIRSTEEALKMGYSHWDIARLNSGRSYRGVFSDSATINLNAECKKTFKKIDEEECVTPCSKPITDESCHYDLYCYHSMDPYRYNVSADNYILLEHSNDSLKGYYYGTTNEFDETGIDYLGFFVLPMDSLQIKNDSISFILQPTENDFFSQPIARSVFSTREALQIGYSTWHIVAINTRKSYQGIFFSPAIIYFLEQDSVSKKVFVKTDWH
ncbi:MAG: hypothetical protein LBR66_04310 [Candidatus Symbiothrix sp.]|jgi:hypothetical protein|nr:hypothetical protein [Candidatus Symbiothrix sp.]